MLRLFLAVVCISHVLAAPNVICTNGFTLVNNNKCLKLYTNETSYKSAESTCVSYGGSLALSKNAIDNRAIASFVGNTVSRFWMGVYCTGNDPTSCFWDDHSTSSYNNFANGFPYEYIGNCVYFSTTGSSAGKWYSTDCMEDMHPYVCEIPTTFEDTCKYNYNGHCYFQSDGINTTMMLPYNRAQEYCELRGANLASIHSAGEMRFILMFLRHSMVPVTIGGVKSSETSFYWTDGTPWDYSYFRSEQAIGCLRINFNANPFFFWTTVNCEEPSLFLCKRPAGGSPAPHPVPVTVAPFPTNSPSCNTSVLLAPGEITSPNYPNNYDNDVTCRYLLATVGTARIKLKYIVFITQTNDKLYVYDGDSEESPLRGAIYGFLTPGSETYYFTESTSNRMTLVFKTDSSGTDLGFHIKFNYVV